MAKNSQMAIDLTVKALDLNGGQGLKSIRASNPTLEAPKVLRATGARARQRGGLVRAKGIKG